MQTQARYGTRQAGSNVPASWSTASQACTEAKGGPEAQTDEGVAARDAVHKPQRKVARAVHHGLHGLAHQPQKLLTASPVFSCARFRCS